MISFVDVELLKKKFATLLSKLYFGASIGLENISEKIIDSDYFLCFEFNNIEKFMSQNYEDICYELFGCRFNKDVNDIGPIYWSGIQYMNIMLNCDIPLKTIFLLCPLQEMVTYFDVYHEMNESKMIERFMEIIKDKSILKELRKRVRLSNRQIYDLTNIDENTLRYLEINHHLFRTAEWKILRLTCALNADDSFFRRHSFFLPLSPYLFSNHEFLTLLSKKISKIYLNEEIDNIPIDFSKGKGDTYLYINSPSLLLYKNRKYEVEDFVLHFIFASSIRELLSSNKNNLLF